MGVVGVLGGTGPAGRSIIARLSARGAVRAIVRRSDAGDIARQAGATEIALGDLEDPDGLAVALNGVGSVHLVIPGPGTPGPRMSATAPHLPADRLVENAVIAAERAGIRRFVLITVMHPFVPAMPHHMEKARAELVLRSSSLRWTILQPATFAQNFLTRVIVRDGEHILPTPYSLDARLSPVDLFDVGDVCVRMHDEGLKHDYATYELAGPEVLTHHEIAACFAAALGMQVRAVQVPLAEAWPGNPPLQVAAELAAMFSHYDRHGFYGNPTVLEMLLGRPPASLRTVLQRSQGVVDESLATA